MRREQSATSLYVPSSPTSSKFFDYRKLNFIAFSSTLVYIGYLFGCMESGDKIVASAFSIGHDDGIDAVDAGRGRLRATPDGASTNRDLTASDRNVDNAKQIDGRDEAPFLSSPSYARGPVIHNNMGQGTSISLIGERHSGTNWITDHLVDCFGDQITVEPEFTRFKHWFQFDDATVRNDSAVVVAMFRDPYDWVEAMRESPHHAHSHVGVPDKGMEWKDFVTKPWVGPRGPADHAKMEKAKEEGIHIKKSECLAGYEFDEVIPCSLEDSVEVHGYSNFMYELKNDGSHRAFDSIIKLRTEKILNFLQVPKFHGVKAFLPERYEALNLRGTDEFLRQLEEVTGLKAECKPLAGSGMVKHKNVHPEFTEWMNRYHDWNAESMIGYAKRDPVPRRDEPAAEEEEQAPEALREPPARSNAQIY